MPEKPEEEQREPEGGPSDRLEQFMEERFAQLGGGDKEAEETEAAPGIERFASRTLDRQAEPPRGPLPSDFRREVVQEYRRRQRAKRARERPAERGEAEGPAADDDAPLPPAPPPASNWIPIGPSVVRRGQGAGTPAMAGRISGLAVARDGSRIYAASANGGVWRSDDGGVTWRSTMDAFDLDPTSVASDSLACGAIAIDQDNPDRVYVGTGEGDTVLIAAGGVVTGSGAYFGVGPIRSDDGGGSWITEPVAGTPTLDGAAFYALAVDPGNPERVVAATTNGLYRREPDGNEGFHWVRKRTALFTSVVAASSGTATTFYAAQWGGGVLTSPDGSTWANAGTGFPTTDIARIGLGVRPTDPSVVYALIERFSDHYILGVWRLDTATGAWRQVPGHPGDLFGEPAPMRRGQGWYDLAVAVDPNDCRTTVGRGFRIRSLAFAGANRIYAGLMNGRVYRHDRTAAGWGAAVRIDNLGAPDSIPSSFATPVTDIAVDPADATGGSIYIAFAGTGDYRHVWHWNGTRWRQRSGPAAGSLDALQDVQANAIVVDPQDPNHLWVGADIGVWHSADAGVTWEPFSEGLPDAGVFDLQLHAVRRLLRASTHGRGVYERSLDATEALAVELYVRDTQLDQGRFPTVDGLADPLRPGQTVAHDRGPDIKLDTPDANGDHQFPPTSDIDFLQFVDVLVDDAQRVATSAAAVITTRVYVQVHNRGVTPAGGVRVMLLVADASTGPPPLPPGFGSDLRSGTPIATPSWRTVGFATLDDVRVGFPKIAAFDLTSDLLAGGDQHCVLALVHHPQDPFTATETATDLLSTSERKSAHKRLTVVRS